MACAFGDGKNARKSMDMTELKSTIRKKFDRIKNDYKTCAALLEFADCMLRGYKIENFGKPLGQGPFSTVRLGSMMAELFRSSPHMRAVLEQRGDGRVAVKAVDQRRAPADYAQKILPREIAAMYSAGGHPNIVELYEVFETSEHTFMILEYCENGNLWDYIQHCRQVYDTPGVPETAARLMFLELCRAVEHCHRRGVVHRDLRCEHVLLDRRQRVKIIDFKQAAVLPNKRVLLRSACAAGPYTAPEVLENRLHDGMAADVWSLGVVLFAMLNGRLPFADHVCSLLEAMRLQRFRLSKRLSQGSRRVLRALLQFDPSARPRVSDVAEMWTCEDAPPPPRPGTSDKVLVRRRSSQVIQQRLMEQELRRQHAARAQRFATVTLGTRGGEAITLRSRVPGPRAPGVQLPRGCFLRPQTAGPPPGGAPLPPSRGGRAHRQVQSSSAARQPAL